jgi:hypothetical protein
MKKTNNKNRSLFTPEEEEALGGRFAASWPGRIGIVAAALFLCFLGVWMLTSVVAQAKNPAPWHGLVHLQKFIKGFHLAGVTMGMTPDMVRTLHPGMALADDSARDTRAIFVAGHIPYMVWFANLDGGQKAYRIRFHRHYDNDTINAALNEFGHKLGRPYSTACHRSELTSSSKTCVFKWLRNGVDVILTSRLVQAPDSEPRTTVTFTATDMQTAAKLRRYAAHPRFFGTAAR